MRRRSQSMFELALDLPWPVGLALATLAYLLMYQVAPRLLDDNPVTAPLGEVFAMLAPYVAGLFVLAALLSFIHWLLDQRLFNRQKDIHTIRQLGWREFERFISAAFRRQGYLSVETPTGADGGVDLVLRRRLEKYYVQCKHWQSRVVGVGVIRELYGIVTAAQVDGGFVVTSGRFSNEAKLFAGGTNIQLIDGEQLARMVEAARDDVENELHRDSTAEALDPMLNVPECPACQRPMVKRQAVRGRYAGAHFWGCSAFPACRRTLSLD